jgi:hypothetical protein
MLKFLNVSRIFNFRMFLIDFSPDFKHVVFSHLDELLGLPYVVGKLEMSSFRLNLNRNKIPHVTSYMSQIIHEYLV